MYVYNTIILRLENLHFLMYTKNFIGLQESYEELQALLLTRSIQEGRSLLTGSNNLAAELEEMTQDDVSICNDLLFAFPFFFSFFSN